VSFARFSSSDIYMYEHVGGFIECCGCSLAKAEDGGVFGFGFTNLNTPREALAHLDEHEAAGDDIGGARVRIEKEYPDLDITIEPYKQDPEVLERIRQKIKEAMERSD
jgi:hypothetical protein